MKCACGQELKDVGNGVWAYEKEEVSRGMPEHKVYRIYDGGGRVDLATGKCDRVVKFLLEEVERLKANQR